MKKTLIICLTVFAVTAVTAAIVVAQEQASKTPPPAGDAARGKTAFMSAGCYTCHGTVGHGGAGARLAPKPREQVGFFAYVRSGRRGWSVAGGMPAYPASVLSNQSLADIYAYLLSIPAPPPLSDIPLLKD
jgi:mono/diheme cytochrome c family protein